MIMMLGEDDVHYLTSYMTKILPELGLDYDTYGPYVTGFANNEEEDESSLDDLIELLQASSETQGDDEESLVFFRKELITRRKQNEKNELKRKVSICIFVTKFILKMENLCAWMVLLKNCIFIIVFITNTYDYFCSSLSVWVCINIIQSIGGAFPT